MPRKDIQGSKMYQATLPLRLHELLHDDAVVAARSGGQININKVLVQRLYDGFKASLSAPERKLIEAFIAKL